MQIEDKTDLAVAPGSGSVFDGTTSPGRYRDITWLPSNLWTHPVPSDVVEAWTRSCGLGTFGAIQGLEARPSGDLIITERLGSVYPDPRQGVFPVVGEPWPADHTMVLAGQWRVPTRKKWDRKAREMYGRWASKSLPVWLALSLRYVEKARAPRPQTVKFLASIFSLPTCRSVTELAMIYRYRRAFDTTCKAEWVKLLMQDGGRVADRIEILKRELGETPPPRQLSRTISRKFFGADSSLPDPEDPMWQLQKIIHQDLCREILQEHQT